MTPENTNLTRNLNLAKWASKRARDLVPYSSNRHKKLTTTQQVILLQLVRRKVPREIKQQVLGLQLSPRNSPIVDDDREIELKDFDNYLHQMTFSELLQLLEEEYTDKEFGGNHRDGSPRRPLECMENDARNSVAVGVGNCGELAAIAYMLLLEYPKEGVDNKHVRIEPMSLRDPGDHCFVVIGRKFRSDINDLSTWGENAVICDPWDGKYFSVQEQLALSRSQRHGIFNYIMEHLVKANDYSESYGVNSKLSQAVGAGHSERWQRKRRRDLIHRSCFFDNNASRLVQPNWEREQDLNEGSLCTA